MEEERNYTVYMHICPNGKRYIGATKQKPSRRFRNGKGYIGTKFYDKAICVYGWNNIVHRILYTNLIYSEASSKEKFLIKYYKTQSDKFGYNVEDGGEFSNMSESTKRKLSELAKQRYRNGQIPSFLGKHHTQETKNKISIANFNPNKETRLKMSINHSDVNGNKNPMFGISPIERMDEKTYKEWLKKQRENKKSGIENPNYGNHKLKYGNNPNATKIKRYDRLLNYIDEFSCIQEAKDVLCLSHIKVDGNISGNYIFVKYNENIKDIKLKNKYRLVIIDNVIFYSIKECSDYIKKNVSDVGNWIRGSKPMPQKYIDRGLRYYNPETDKDLPIYQNKD